MVESSDVLILGAGFTGLAAAWALGDRAIIVEREDRPGGVVRSERIGDYWFDHVVHLLYFQDPDTERRIRGLLGETLAPCPPRAWVETARGTARFPLQLHLGDLDTETCVRCCREIAELTYAPPAEAPANFEQMLLRTFGPTLCETFLFPYNRKMWQRPLRDLAPSGFTWNIAMPDLDRVLRGAIAPDFDSGSYNAAGWYPRPPAGAPVRGMEVVSRAIAGQAADLRLRHRVRSIDLDRRIVEVERTGSDGGASITKLRYRDDLLSTIPLPALIGLCEQAPVDLKTRCAGLLRNRVLSVLLAIEGPRPEAPGHWRYYADESLIFTRLIFLHEFDAMCAPPEGWSLLVEIPQPAEQPMPDAEALLQRVIADARCAGAIDGGSHVAHRAIVPIDPAYVVFRPESQPVIADARAFCDAWGVSSLGRYGAWEYCGMSKCLHDGFAWAESLSRPEPPAPEVPARRAGVTR
ncbi:MAG: protoporphyrinogen/coproporphyrinogen oxidase [Phycisphaerales bacterium JB039]